MEIDNHITRSNQNCTQLYSASSCKLSFKSGTDIAIDNYRYDIALIDE